MKYAIPTLYVVGLYGAYMAGSIWLRGRDRGAERASEQTARRAPLTTVLLALAIAVPSSLQFFFPWMLPGLQRDYEQILRGEWWRMVTALFVQDGGVRGAVFNLLSLLLVGAIAEQLWGGKRMLILFFAGAVIGELAGIAWQPIGAGNSVGNFSVAAGIAIISLMRQHNKIAIIGALAALGANAVLIVLHDIHGAAALAGALTTLGFSQPWRHGRTVSPPDRNG